MLTYTFSRREKSLILVLAIVVIAIVWYMVVYQSTTNQLTQIRGEQAMVEDETALASAQVTQMNYMRDVVEQRKAEGVTPTPIPEYDNVHPLMTQLDAMLSATTTYQLSFEQLSLGDRGYILRPVSISFTCDDYETAVSLVDALAYGIYPCTIDSVSINNNYANVNASTSSGSSGAIHVTFFEKNDGSFVVETDETA